MRTRNKKAEQFEAKQKHYEQLRAKRRSESLFERSAPGLSKKPTILIVCEGENTEPSYFNHFRLSSSTIKSVGEGYNTISLVNRALQLMEEHEYEYVWCVFDKDDFDDNDFNNAISLAEANNIGVAYSNQAFEYWIILHFDDHQGGGMSRRDYDEKINKLLQPYNVTYDGLRSKKITEEIFAVLNGTDEKTKETRVDLAIKRAERNYDQFDHTNLASKESSTTVFRLVKDLQKYI